MAIQVWPKGKSKVLVSKYGRSVTSTMFTNPATGEEEEFVLIHMRSGAVIIPVTPDGMVILGKQFMQGANKVCLESPGGRGDFEQEPPAEIAKRELLEETGYEAGEMIQLGAPQWIDSRSCTTQNWLFLALDCKKVRWSRDSTEQIEPLQIPLSRWIALAESELEEPYMGLATFRAIPYLRDKGLL